MRLLFLTSAREGIAGYWRAFNLGKNLVKRGHQVSLIAQSNKPSFHAVSKIADGVQISLIPTLIPSGKNFAFETAARTLTLLMQTGLNLLRDITSKVDIIHVFDFAFPQNAMPVLFSKVKPGSNKPVIFVDWDDWMGRGGALNLFHGNGAYQSVIPFLTFLEEKIPLLANAVTVTTETLHKRALDVGVQEKDIVLIPNGTDTDAIKPLDMSRAREHVGLPSEAIVYTLNKSSFSIPAQSNDPLCDLLLAHRIVTAKVPNALLLLLGRGSESYLTLAKFLKIERNVLCVGRQPPNEFSQYLTASNFLLLLIRDTPFDRARLPLRLTDYMAAGRPVIATALPEIERVVDGCGLLVKPNDPEDLADKILYAIQEPSLCKKMGEEARDKAVKKYSWLTLAERLEEVYYKYL